MKESNQNTQDSNLPDLPDLDFDLGEIPELDSFNESVSGEGGSSDLLDSDLPELGGGEELIAQLPVETEDGADDEDPLGEYVNDDFASSGDDSLESLSTSPLSQLEDKDAGEGIELSSDELRSVMEHSDTHFFEDLTEENEAMSSGALDLHEPGALFGETGAERMGIQGESGLDQTGAEFHFQDDLEDLELPGAPDLMDETSAGEGGLSFMDRAAPPQDIYLDGMPGEVEAEAPGDEEDKEPVALSEEELGNILSDVDETGEVFMGGMDEGVELPELGEFPPEMELEEVGIPELEGGFETELDDESEVTLSDSELDNILSDTGAGEVPEWEETSTESRAIDEFAEPMPSALDFDVEDGPIALTPEELGNIVQDVSEEEEVAETSPEIFETPSEEEAPFHSILDESDEDNEPVTLSDNELENILEDVTESEEPGISAGFAEEEKGSRDRLIEEHAEVTGLEKDELKKMISYLDSLFDQLPEETVRKFSQSEYFDLYKKIMTELGL